MADANCFFDLPGRMYQSKKLNDSNYELNQINHFFINKNLDNIYNITDLIVLCSF